jgi:7-carboxy-7-deazaguanine synthase
MQRVNEIGGKLVEITGGEPLLQEEVYPLMDRLLGDGYTVMLETSGERRIDRVPEQVIKIVDVKCPDSGEGDTFAEENLGYVARHDQIKFVIASRRDYEFAREFTRSHNLSERAAAVIFSPVHGKVDLAQMAGWILKDGLERVRFGSQLHKIIWGPEAQGV